MARRSHRLLFGILSGVALLVGGALLSDWWVCLPEDAVATYVGRQSCVQCHTTQAEQWKGSHHDYAMDVANEQSVRGDFSGAEITHFNVTSRMYRQGDKYMVHTEGPKGTMSDFQVKYTFGWDPLQQYLVEFDRPVDMSEDELSRLQVLPLCWDTKAKRWFYLTPPDVTDEKLQPIDPLYWTNTGQNWNTMCADCHSTHLERRYDFDTDTYHATFSEIDVSCEACHGPASLHLQLATSRSLFWDRKRGYALTQLKGRDGRAEVEVCATCHSRRRMVHTGFHPGAAYYDHFVNDVLTPHLYHASGHVRDEVYVYGSFAQSKMYEKGVRCTNCHNPHTARLKAQGNRLCTSCHQHAAGKYDSPAHHFHDPESSGAQCVECHMPATTYMAVDPRRDHRLAVPRPDLSVKLGTPNACSGCHLDRAALSRDKRQHLHEYADWLARAQAGDEEVRQALLRVDRWSDETVKRWYGEKDRDGGKTAFAEILSAAWEGDPSVERGLVDLALDRGRPGIVRASAVRELAQFESPLVRDAVRKALRDSDPQVRYAAASIYVEVVAGSEGVDDVVRALTPLFNDPVHVVCVEAAGSLVSVPPGSLTSQQRNRQSELLNQWRNDLLASMDPGMAQINLGIHYERTAMDETRLMQAVAAYRKAIRLSPESVGPRSNLAVVLEKLSDGYRRIIAAGMPRKETDEKLALLQVEIKKLRQEELELLARDVRQIPDTTVARAHAALLFRYGLALLLDGQRQKAHDALVRATQLAPHHPYFLFVLGKLYEDQRDFERALQVARRLVELRPSNNMYRLFLKELETAMGEP